MDLESMILSKASQQRKTKIIWHPLCVETLKNDMNELIYKIEKDTQTE